MEHCNTLVPVPFRNTTLFVTDINGQPYVPMRPVVEGMGLTWQSQHLKLIGNQRFSTCVTEIVTQMPGDDQRRAMTCMPLRKLPGWMTSIHPNKVRPEIRDNIIAYQNECDDVLWDYWSKGQAINPRPAPEFTLGSDKLFPSEQQTLSEIVHSKAAHLPAETQGKALAEIWSRMHNKFRVSKYSDLQRERLAEAIIYVNQMELRGVKSPAPQPALPMPPASSSGRWLVARDRSGEWSLFEIPKEAFVLKAEEWPGVIRTNDFPEELLKKVLVAVSERMK